MTEKRNTDWTDKLRERLSDSELSPSADVWSKVESAAAPSRKSVPAAAWWGFALAAAASAVLLFIPKGGNVVEVASEPQQTMLAEVINEREDLVAEEKTAPKAAETLEVPAVADTTASLTVVEPPTDFAVADTTASLTVAEPPTDFAVADASAAPAVAEDRTVDSEQDAEYDFGAVPEKRYRPRKKMGVSLFACGIPGNSGLNSRPDIIVLSPESVATRMSSDGLDFLNSVSNNVTIVVIDDSKGTFACNAGGFGVSSDGMEYYQILGREARHHRPVSFGITLTYPLVRNVFLESGLSYTFLRSEFAGNLGDQRLHFLGVPLKLGYRFDTPSNFSVALSAGAMAEKCIYGELFGSRIAVKEPLFSAVATASLYYSLGQNLSLFVAPDLSYYFTRTSVPTYRTERPLSMTLRLGVNVNIDR
ncbi:MAG: hypothetical protein MJY73_05645 [Bacteroidales bacterium]|nr:hypothetical protein [Bacteroidales bacterium]